MRIIKAEVCVICRRLRQITQTKALTLSLPKGLLTTLLGFMGIFWLLLGYEGIKWVFVVYLIQIISYMRFILYGVNNTAEILFNTAICFEPLYN